MSVGRFANVGSWGLAAILLTGVTGGATETPRGEQPPAKLNFSHDVLPLLEQHCFRCHRGANASSGHRLDDRAELLGQNDGEPLVIPGQAEQSLLWRMAAGRIDDRLMPPTGAGRRLTEPELAVLKAWIDQGLAWDTERLPPIGASSDHWAFQPLRRPTIPPILAADGDHPIDAFLDHERAARKVPLATLADPRTRIRRLYLTLTGLPPSSAEVDRFVMAPTAEAYEKLVARLLVSPAYAERWARHWLDLARWAESEGYESNHPRPFAWRYRDYVLNAFRNDKPYDRFVHEQIAGDEITPFCDEQLIATGFLAAARLSSNEEDKQLQVNDLLVDTVNTVGSVFLGLTIGCAQCHNHKLEPITQRDYYQLQGFFLQGRPNNLALVDDPAVAAYEKSLPSEYRQWLAERDAIYESTRQRVVAERLSMLAIEYQRALAKPAAERSSEEQRLAQRADAQLQFTRNGIEKGITPAERARYDTLQRQIADCEKKLPVRPQTWGFYSPVTGARALDVLPMKGFYPPPYDPAQLREARPTLLVRGDVHRPGPTLDVGWPMVLGRQPRDASQLPTRSQLANWLTSRENPLVARVWVNRLWHYHFGEGLVATTSDLGVAGARPTHQALLDWLAVELIDSGWSTRHIQRLIVMSRSFGQCREPVDAPRLPHEPLAWEYWRPRRLEAEAIRDSILSVTGELDPTYGGVSVPPDQESTTTRRSLYLTHRREEMPRMLTLFDSAEANESCAAREVSTVALQPLFLLNSPFMNERARALAQRTLVEAGQTDDARLNCAFERVLQRRPDANERQAALDFLARGLQRREDRWTQLCLVLLNLNEFLYIP